MQPPASDLPPPAQAGGAENRHDPPPDHASDGPAVRAVLRDDAHRLRFDLTEGEAVYRDLLPVDQAALARILAGEPCPDC